MLFTSKSFWKPSITPILQPANRGNQPLTTSVLHFKKPNRIPNNHPSISSWNYYFQWYMFSPHKNYASTAISQTNLHNENSNSDWTLSQTNYPNDQNQNKSNNHDSQVLNFQKISINKIWQSGIRSLTSIHIAANNSLTQPSQLYFQPAWWDTTNITSNLKPWS